MHLWYTYMYEYIIELCMLSCIGPILVLSVRSVEVALRTNYKYSLYRHIGYAMVYSTRAIYIYILLQL